MTENEIPPNMPELLHAWIEDRDPQALTQLTQILKPQLVSLARKRLLGERTCKAYPTSAMIHQWYASIHEAENARGLEEFYALIAQQLRQLLVNKNIDFQSTYTQPGSSPIKQFDHALQSFARQWPTQARVVDLHFILGLDFAEISHIMRITESKISNCWIFANAWLKREMSGGSDETYAN